MSLIWSLYRQRNLHDGRLARNSSLWLIAIVPTTEEHKVGATIIRQGASGTAFYILEKGAVEVVKDGVILNVLMYPGTIFGEVSAILGKPRTSTVRTRTLTTVTKYEGMDLPSFVSEHPEIAAKMLETLASRLEHTTQRLTDSL